MALCLFTLAEVNYPRLAPQSQLAIFAMLGLVLCFLNRPLHPRLAGRPVARIVDAGLALLAVACCSFIIVQTEPWFESLWIGGQSTCVPSGHDAAYSCADRQPGKAPRHSQARMMLASAAAVSLLPPTVIWFCTISNMIWRS